MADNSDLSTRLRSAISRTLDHLERQIAIVEARALEFEPGGFDESVARAGSALSRAISDLSNELRQLEKHDKRMTLTPEQRFSELLKYVRTLDPVQTATLLEVLTESQRGRAA